MRLLLRFLKRQRPIHLLYKVPTESTVQNMYWSTFFTHLFITYQRAGGVTCGGDGGQERAEGLVVKKVKGLVRGPGNIMKDFVR